MSRQIIPANPLNGFYQLIGELGHDYWTELSKHSKQNFIAFQEESDSFFFNPQYEYWSQHLTLIAKIYTSYIGETGRRLGDLFQGHLRGGKRNDKDAFKPVARHFNLLNHSNSILQFAAFPYVYVVWKAAKLVQIGTVNPLCINELFIQLIFLNYFLVTMFRPIV